VSFCISSHADSSRWLREFVFADPFVVCRRQRDRFELLLRAAGFDNFCRQAGAGNQVDDQLTVFAHDDELAAGVVVVRVLYIDPKELRVAVLADCPEHLQRLLLGYGVPRQAVENWLGLDRQELTAGLAVLLLQGGLERGEGGACVGRTVVVGAARKGGQQQQRGGARIHVVDIVMSQPGTGMDPGARAIWRTVLHLASVGHTGRMLFPRHWPLVAACLAVGVGTLQAQNGKVERVFRPTFGRVVDADGKALADATVTLVGGLPHLLPALQDIHVTEVGTDKRGRAMARLQQGLCYVAWVSGPAVDGKITTSNVIGYFAAGAMFELTCGEARDVSTCTLTGEDKWQHVGKLRYFAMTSMPGTEVELERSTDGVFQLPGKPFDSFEVRLPDDQALWHAPMGDDLHLPPPQSVRVRAVDADGNALAGAKVKHRVGRLSSWRLDGLRSVGEDRMRSLGVTDDDGLCVVEVPYDTNPLEDGLANLLLFVESEGRPAVAGGIWNRFFYVSDHKVPEIKGDELRFECAEVEPLRGVMPTAPPGTTAHLTAICKLYLPRNSYQHDARVFTADVAKDGTFAFADLPAELHSCRVSFLPPIGSAWLPPVFAPEPSRELPELLVPLPDGDEHSLELVSLNLTVSDPTGGPARGAVAFLSSGDRSGILLRDSLLRVALNERGAAHLRLMPGNWVVVVLTASGYCGVPFELDETTSKASVQLEPLALMKVTLKDGSGKPVVGAGVRSRGTTTRGTNDPVSSILQGLGRTARTHWQRLRTDDAGQVEIPFVPVVGVQQRVELRWDDGRSEEFELEADTKVTIGVAKKSDKGSRLRRRPK
jgi:hypothetical protein